MLILLLILFIWLFSVTILYYRKIVTDMNEGFWKGLLIAFAPVTLATLVILFGIRVFFEDFDDIV